jgi:class 3 adenylate cyclase/tetratricopeptide (TPR) repeat protein
VKTSDQLAQAIAALESQRSLLGDAATDAALQALRKEERSADRQPAGQMRENSQLLAAERKLVTVMFADISGFTALSEKMDPETVRDLMNACFARLVPIVAKYEGTVDKFIGDEIMALFGAPFTHENDPERAVASALEMMAAMRAFNKERGLDLGMHFGINTGLVIAGSVGSDERLDYSVMGDAVNLASRLEDLSERGEILVGPDTYRLTEKLFEFEALPKIRVKGKAEQVQVYRVLGSKSAAARMDSSTRRRVGARLVGRDAEFAAVTQHMERLLDGRGHVVAVIGEAGLGKTRLMAEVRDQVLRNRVSGFVQWLEGRTISFGQAISHHPFQDILWQLAGITSSCGATEAWQRLEAAVRQVMGEDSDEVLPYLAALISLDVPDTHAHRVRFLDAEALRRQIYLASRRFFEACARNRPLVLVFEDLHWADASSASLIEHLMPAVKHLPMLIVWVSRPDPGTHAARLRELAESDYGDFYHEVNLTPLSRRDSGSLAAELLEMQALGAEITESILRKAEGNPFFLEEIVRSLLDTGKVTRDPSTGAWRTTELDAVAIPDTIQGVIMARVDRLDKDLRHVLRTASVIGRNFFYQVLRSIHDADRQLDDHLASLQQFDFIREKSGHPDLEYMFKHAIAQQATYETILLKKRRELHLKVAETLEGLFSDRLEEICGLLAGHYSRAEVWDKAQRYLLMAGDQAGRIAADTEALAHYQQAMEAYEKAFGDQWDPLERASLHRKIGEALFRRGQNAQALDYFQGALRDLGKPLPATQTRTRLAAMAELFKQVSHRLVPWLVTRPGSRPIDVRVREELGLYEAIGWIDAFGDYERFALISLAALNTSERAGYEDGVVKGLMGLGTMCDLVGLFRIAAWYHRRGQRAAEAGENPRAQGLVHIGLTLHHICLAEWDTALHHARRASLMFRETGDLRGLGCSLYFAAVALAYQGHFANALSHCDDLTRIGDDGSDPQVLCWGLATRGFVLRMMERFQEAEAALSQAHEIAETIQDHVVLMWSASELGRVHLRQNRADQAATELELSREFQTRHPHLSLIWVPLRNALCQASIADAEDKPAYDRNAAMVRARKLCSEALTNGKRYHALLPEAQRLWGVYQSLRGKLRKAEKWWTRSIRQAEAKEQRHDAALSKMEMEARMSKERHREPSRDA